MDISGGHETLTSSLTIVCWIFVKLLALYITIIILSDEEVNVSKNAAQIWWLQELSETNFCRGYYHCHRVCLIVFLTYFSKVIPCSFYDDT